MEYLRASEQLVGFEGYFCAGIYAENFTFIQPNTTLNTS